MAEVESYTPGTPSWVDLGSADPKASCAFYGSLFGWDLQDMGEEAGHYTMATKNGKNVAGIGGLMSEGQPTAWTVYISVEDADATAEKVKAAGGMVYAEPFDVMTVGRMGVFGDTTGAAIAVWQPGDHKGAQLKDEPGSFTWIELWTRDTEKAKAFYGDVFGWTSETHDMGGTDYTEWKLDGSSASGGMMDMPADVPAEVPSHWVVYFEVDDVDASVTAASDLGAKVLVPAMDIPPGRFAVIQDPIGAPLALFKSAPQPAEG
ncbi:MAG TPA: VOC family protein [Acidimicrobiales bacterium]|nr:VOC family protein [Acidimicrobiales bacterium]